MTHNNQLITIAIILITIAGIGWFITSQAEETASRPQKDQLVDTPLVEETATNTMTHRTNQGYRHRNQATTRQHCHEQWAQ